MLFERRFHDAIRRGDITLSVRLWSSPRVKAGGRYRSGALGMVEVESVAKLRIDRLRQTDARRAGFADRDELVAYLARKARRRVRADSSIYRVAFRYAGQPHAADRPDTGDALSEDEWAALELRLDRMDERSAHGPFTRRVLRTIARRPGVAASRLAPSLGRDTQPFKADVRKLKKLGLTQSLEVGYEISPRGRALLARR